MKVTVKLFATLEQFLPEGARDHQVTLDVEPATTVQALLDRLQIPEDLRHLVLRNGVYIPFEQRTEARLQEGDALAVWPQVAGG